MARYALTNPDSVIENIIEWDGDEGGYPVPDGYTLDLLEEGDVPDYATIDTTKYIKITRYTTNYPGNKTEPAVDLNYDTGLDRRLYKKQFLTHGELDKVEYYADTSTGGDGWPTYSDLILKEEMSYTRNSLGFAKERTTVITWYCEDGTAHATTKILHKPYSPLESQQEGVTRRGNIIDQLSIIVAGYLAAVLPTNETYPDAQAKIEVGRLFMAAHKSSMDMFIKASERAIVSEIKHAADSWLDIIIDGHGTHIRDLLRNEIDIWGIWDSV